MRILCLRIIYIVIQCSFIGFLYSSLGTTDLVKARLNNSLYSIRFDKFVLLTLGSHEDEKHLGQSSRADCDVFGLNNSLSQGVDDNLDTNVKREMDTLMTFLDDLL